MDENLARLERQYPNGRYVAIGAYNPKLFETREYDSSFDTKVAENRWKTTPLTYEEAQARVEAGARVGWVVPEGYVIIDIDNKDNPMTSDKILALLDKFEVHYNVNYTSKGVHILLRDDGSIKTDSRMKCALNCEIDTRANGTGYIVLPCNDPHRAWGKWNDVVEEIPYFMKPLMKDGTPSFVGLSDGDGRNDALFRWRSKLEMTHKLNDKEIEKSLRIINENIFDIPMSNEEMYKTVLRKKEDKKVKAEKGNVYNECAEQLMAKYDFFCYYGEFYKYNGTYYEHLDERQMEQLIHLEISKNISKAGRKEIMEFIKIKTDTPAEELNKDWHKIACKNGVINLVTGELEQPNKMEYNTISIPHEYNADPPYSPRIDEFMKQLTGGDLVKMEFLYQVAGYCLLKKNIFQKFVICKGEGGTGKSTYTNLILRLVGDINSSHVGLDALDKDYYLSTTVAKLVNIDDDVVDGKMLENTGRFKSMVAGEKISVRQIYREVIDFYPFATCIFSCNKLPRIMDKTSGLYRRMILVELNNKVTKPDPLFMNKVSVTDMQYFLFKAVEGIKKAIEEGHFRITQSEQNLLKMFKRRQNPLNEWLYENDMSLGAIHNQRCLTLYKMFGEWYDENGYNKKMSAFTFKEDICTLYDVEIRNMVIEEGRAPQMVFYKPGLFNPTYKPF